MKHHVYKLTVTNNFNCELLAKPPSAINLNRTAVAVPGDNQVLSCCYTRLSVRVSQVQCR